MDAAGMRGRAGPEDQQDLHPWSGLGPPSERQPPHAYDPRLGGIVDDELPFHWKTADYLNYRSVVTTLVDRGTGILEIL
jgi:hypothetical protein